MAQVIERFAAGFWERYALQITVDQRRALQAILQCRTPALGGHCYACSCGHRHHAFHSCNHRLCPRCGGSDTQAWVGKQLGRLLPVSYYMVTFTVPAGLRPVLLGKREAMESLMRCSSKALRELLADPARCGFQRCGFFGVYQSWTQDMRFHPHVHYVVPAAGLDAKWRLRRPKDPRFLIHAAPLAMRLRTLLCQQLRAAGLIDAQLFWKLVKMDWNASVDRAGSGENAVKYLGQYIRKSVISDSRILGIEGSNVRIRIKNRTTGAFDSILIDGVEFIRRFLLHALPQRFHRIRYLGFLHARGKTALHWLQMLLDAKLRPQPSAQPLPRGQCAMRCPRCGGALFSISRMPRAPPAQRNYTFMATVAA